MNKKTLVSLGSILMLTSAYIVAPKVEAYRRYKRFKNTISNYLFEVQDME